MTVGNDDQFYGGPPISDPGGLKVFEHFVIPFQSTWNILVALKTWNTWQHLRGEGWLIMKLITPLILTEDSYKKLAPYLQQSIFNFVHKIAKTWYPGWSKISCRYFHEIYCNKFCNLQWFLLFLFVSFECRDLVDPSNVGESLCSKLTSDPSFISSINFLNWILDKDLSTPYKNNMLILHKENRLTELDPWWKTNGTLFRMCAFKSSRLYKD